MSLTYASIHIQQRKLSNIEDENKIHDKNLIFVDLVMLIVLFVQFLSIFFGFYLKHKRKSSFEGNRSYIEWQSTYYIGKILLVCRFCHADHFCYLNFQFIYSNFYHIRQDKTQTKMVKTVIKGQ